MKRKLFIIMFAVLLILTALVIRFSRYYTLAFDMYTEKGVSAEIASEINKIITHEINTYNMQYDEIARIKCADDGTIISIGIDSAKINSFVLKIENEILTNINSASKEFGIPLGNMTGLKVLSGKGPKINVEILPVSNVMHDIESQMISGGINQTLHRISVEFNTEFICIAPFQKTTETIKTKIVIAETVIVGKIPDVFLSPVE